jgi:exodeoxyribonuclease-5
MNEEILTLEEIKTHKLIDRRGLNHDVVDTLKDSQHINPNTFELTNNFEDGFHLLDDMFENKTQTLIYVVDGKIKDAYKLEKIEVSEKKDVFLTLPEVIKKVDVEKTTKVFDPNVEMLTPEQLEIFNKITNIKLSKFSQSLITGYSGTGKTFLVSKIVEKIIFNNAKNHVSIAITAPTNKAVKVLKNTSSVSEDSNHVSFITLHSLLSLKRTITNDGKEVYAQDIYGEIVIYDVVLVDEVSMLDNELYQLLLEYAIMNKVMLLFIGDRGQIPPVNGGESILFSSKLDNNYNLTKIIRQSENNPIIKLAENVRNGVDIVKEDSVNENGDGVIFLKIKSEKELLEKYFKSEHFKLDPNFVKVLCWTNSAVDYYNNSIRKMIYGDNCGRLCVGEKMITNKPVLNSKNQTILNNNDEFEIVSFTVKKENKKYSFSYYNVEILSDKKRKTIKILHEDSAVEFALMLKKLSDKAKKETGFNKTNAWREYYALLERYADVKYNYALTIHKSQGSTFDNSIVLNCDIERNKNKVERSKLLYTAITRAKNKLIII